MKPLIVTCLLVISNIYLGKVYGQDKNNIGISFQLENVSSNITQVNDLGSKKISQSKIYFIPALSYERKLTPRSGFEIELKYRHGIVSDVYLTVTNESGGFPGYFGERHYSIKESYISVPVLYKFNSNIINFSIGPAIEYLFKKEQLNVTPNTYHLGDEFYTKKWSLGFLTKISKSINLYKKILAEPTLVYNPVLSFKRSYFGIAIAAKYKF